MPNWMRADNKQDDDLKSIEIKPEQITTAVKPELDKLKTELSSTMDEKLKDISEFIRAQKEEKEAAARAAAEKQRREANQNNQPTDEEWIVDPKSAVEKMLTPLQTTIAAQSSIIVRNETLKDMDYYASDPAFKAKVDALIDAQPLGARASAAVIMNAYKSVFYDERKAIEEGKYKSIASATSLSNNGTGGHSGDTKTDREEKLSDEEKVYARRLGLTEKEWLDGKKELEYV